MTEKEQMNVVFVGHVDHGKSTILGRLLADTNSLPKGKLEATKKYCENNSKPFEYAFLLDALKDEQAQGITIDSARCFFKSKKRDYIIIDAPGHIEFLKNMVSGAARAEAAILIIDAKEGVQENSKRHAYILSMLGIDQIAVCVNKMDLVGYDQKVFENIRDEYEKFLGEINIKPAFFIPASGTRGDNIAIGSKKLSWFKGPSILEALDGFEKEAPPEDKPFRMAVQDVYKFTREGDDRRIVAGRVSSGTINVGDDVIFFPSNKGSTIKSIEEFSAPKKDRVSVGKSIGFTLTEQIYIKRGELMCKKNDDAPQVSSLITANVFWMGKTPLEKHKEYRLKIGTVKVPMKIKDIITVLDTSKLSKTNKNRVERHEVAECLIECLSPLAFDLFRDIKETGRFVIVDGYDVAGGGIITDYKKDGVSKVWDKVFLREQKWESGLISFEDRVTRYSQIPTVVMITGESGVDKKSVAKDVEKKLFDRGQLVYFLGIGNLLRGVDSDIDKKSREEHIRRLGEVSHILMRAGLIVIATASDLRENELRLLSAVLGEDSIITVTVGKNGFAESIIDLSLDEKENKETNTQRVIELLQFKKIIYGIR